MNVVRADRSPGPAACAHWSRTPATSPPSGLPNAGVDHYAAPVRVRPGESASAAFIHVRDRLLAYDVFPPALIRYAICPAGSIRAGATIVQQILLGPIALEMAVRVVDAWDRSEGGAREAGFSYVTLQGHPERGVATFRVRLDAAGAVTVLIDARSRPGLLLTRLGRPIARGFQRALTRAALRRLAEGEGPGISP